MTFNDDTNILQMNGIEFNQQNYNKIIGVQVVEVFDNAENESPSLYKCFFRLQTGVRLITKSNQEDQKVMFEIVAEHDAVFESKDRIDESILEKFSESEEISNSIWPYWKEHVSSICSKAGISPLNIPAPKKNKPIKITGSKQL